MEIKDKKLLKAIANFQQTVPVIHQESKGYGYTYANLSTIFKIINPILKENNLGFIQLLDGDSLKTIIFHTESGEQIDSIVNIKQDVKLGGMNPFQVLGSAITYYRRYSLAAALGLITDEDTDAKGKEVVDNKPHVIMMNSPKKTVEQRLEACTTLDQLEATYKSLTQKEQLDNKACGNKMKTKLTK